MALWNITNVIRFEYFVHADSAHEAVKASFEEDADEINESWHATEIDEDEEPDTPTEPVVS